ncbi:MULTISPECIES: aminoacyl-tRNA hydrolase [unclassified Luteococcus]|uniref:aminoacyl-tRNA hydrolase n=1 Tax=unclassified Luteococcus TaxID=2639923 RepID=UPI00313C3E1A
MTTFLVVGLGNPGPSYANTRHNVGFMVVDELARRARASWSAPRQMRADVAETRISRAGMGAPGIDAHKVVLVKPRTFMNESGQAVGKLAAFHKVAPAQVVAVHDELDLDLGQLRLKLGGGDNGHNGLKSMRRHLSTGDFARVRFGIGRPPGRQQPADYVLAQIPASLRTDVALEVGRAADAVELLLTDGLEAAQNRFNS